MISTTPLVGEDGYETARRRIVCSEASCSGERWRATGEIVREMGWKP